MLLKNTNTGKIYKIVSGFILNEENYKKMNVTGSFLTLKSLDTEEEVLYNWKYWAPNDYEQCEENENEERIATNSGGDGSVVEDSPASSESNGGSEGLSAGVYDRSGAGGGQC